MADETIELFKKLLAKADLPADPKKVIKRYFRFMPIQQGHFIHRSLWGRIEGIELGAAADDFRIDTGIIEFSKGLEITWFGFDADEEKGWGIMTIRKDNGEADIYRGKLVLL